MNKVVIFIVGTAFYYVISIVLLLVLSSVFHESFDNIWLSALPITIAAEVLLLISYLWKKFKKRFFR